jgi:hypothetical protein
MSIHEAIGIDYQEIATLSRFVMRLERNYGSQEAERCFNELSKAFETAGLFTNKND